MRRPLTVSALVVLLLASTVSAQIVYIDHRTYQPPNGEDPVAFGARLRPGDPVAERPGYAWQHDGRGWYWELATTPTPGQVPPDVGGPPSPEDCRDMNPYLDPAHAMECTLRHTPPRPPLPVYSVGARYTGAYGGGLMQMTVIGLARSVDGVEVVTFQWLTRSNSPEGQQIGDVTACRNDGGSGATSCSVWLPAR